MALLFTVSSWGTEVSARTILDHSTARQSGWLATAAVVSAWSAGRFGHWQSDAVCCLHLSPWRFLAAAEVDTVSTPRRCRGHELPAAVCLRFPSRGVLAATAALGHPTSRRRGLPKCTAAAADPLPGGRALAVVQSAWRRCSGQPAHLHALSAATHRRRNGRPNWKFRVRSNRVREQRGSRGRQPYVDWK